MKKKKNFKLLFDKPPKSDFITIKTSLKTVLKNYDINFPIINQLVLDFNDVAITTYQFIKLYILKCYHENKEIPELTEELLKCFTRSCGIKINRGTIKNQDFQNELNEFYSTEFQPCINKEKYSLYNKKYTEMYLITQIHTAIYNNLKEHFLTRFRRFINLTFPLKLYTEDGKKIKEALRISNIVKQALLQDNLSKVPDNLIWYFNWVKDNYLPIVNLDKKGHGYNVKVNPHQYLKFTIKMNDRLETINNNKPKQEQFKLFNISPLRTQIIPKYITLDACGILNLLDIPLTNYLKQHPIKQENNRLNIWSKLFKIDNKVFKMKDYEFKTIQTDGVGVSICFQKITKMSKQEVKIENQKQDKYITDLTEEELELCKKCTLIGGDPGKDNLLFLMNEAKKKLRYTSIQRKVESENKKYNSIIRSKKFHAGIAKLETIVSNYNSKTVNYEEFKKYIKAKTELNDLVKEFYQDIKFRKFKWRVWGRQRSSEDKFINNIGKSFGQDILICYGDWSNNKQMKYIMPTKGIGLRRKVSKKYKTVLIDEYKTSITCSNCKNKLKNLKKAGKKVHRVLTCQNCKSDSSESKQVIFMNRDINACINILTIAKQAFLGTRPIEFSRNNQEFTVSDVPSTLRMNVQDQPFSTALRTSLMETTLDSL